VAAAADALQAGDLDLAVAGGAELGIDPVWLALQARADTLGTDEMRVYAADPAGLLPGEGCGIVVLARAADARAAGVPVYAEIAGWSTVPASPRALAGPALLQAYHQAGIDPADIQLVEGQGTGTAASDSAELAALAQLRRGGRAIAPLGAVSASIGYTKAAAGIASLVKTAVAMAAGTIPPGTGCARPHPLIESGDTLLRLPTRPEPWPDGTPKTPKTPKTLGTPGTRLAAVNSLGTADPAAMLGLSGLRDAEGVHLVLRREGETDRWPGRRRRMAKERTTPEAAPGSSAGPGPPAPGRHTTPIRLSAPTEARPPAAGPAHATQPPAADKPTHVMQPPAADKPTHVMQPPAADKPTHVMQPPAAGAPARAMQPPAVGKAVPWGTSEPSCGTTELLISRAEHPNVFALCGGDLGALAGRLEVIAASASMLTDAELNELARQLALGLLRAGDDAAVLRVALTADTPHQLAAQARHAARLLRTSGPAVTGPALTGASVTGAAAVTEPGVRISAGATGAVVVLFPGRAESGAGQPALLASSLQALATLDRLGVKPVAGVGYGLGEITGLTWAGSLPPAEAARLVAQCGQVLRACACCPAAMARITADAEVARALCAPDRLHVAAYEGPSTHVLAGSTAGIRELARRAGALGIPVEVLGGVEGSGPMHSPAMARCVAPLRSVLAGTRFAPPRRRLISTVTGRLLTPGDDIAELLASQVSLPVLFAQAITLAAEGADLIVTAGPDASLAAAAAKCAGVPAIAIPAPGPAGGLVRADADRQTLAKAIAALFAAGAITDLGPFLMSSRPAGTLASRTVPRMRDAEPPAPNTDDPDTGADQKTTVRSVN
jgi:malonyl CoA-acyl carrier protein transacylase